MTRMSSAATPKSAAASPNMADAASCGTGRGRDKGLFKNIKANTKDKPTSNTSAATEPAIHHHLCFISSLFAPHNPPVDQSLPPGSSALLDIPDRIIVNRRTHRCGFPPPVVHHGHDSDRSPLGKEVTPHTPFKRHPRRHLNDTLLRP